MNQNNTYPFVNYRVGAYSVYLSLQDSHISKLPRLPDWLESNFNTLMEVFDALWLVNKVPEVARLTTGALLADMRTNMLKKRNEASKFQLFVYSGVISERCLVESCKNI